MCFVLTYYKQKQILYWQYIFFKPWFYICLLKNILFFYVYFFKKVCCIYIINVFGDNHHCLTHCLAMLQELTAGEEHQMGYQQIDSSARSSKLDLPSATAEKTRSRHSLNTIHLNNNASASSSKKDNSAHTVSTKS